MEEQNIYHLIVRNLTNQADAEDTQALQSWIEASEENREEFERIKILWTKGKLPVDQTEIAAALARTRAKRDQVLEDSDILAGRSWIAWVRYAAAVLLVGIVGYFVYFQTQKETFVVKTTHQTIDSVLLSDGSKIFLSANSQLRYPKEIKGNTRNVSLIDGEAFFEIAKDPSRPFKVEINGSKVTVLGTSFNIRNRLTDVRLTVNSGRVAFEPLAGEDELILTPGMGVDFNSRERRLTRFSSINQNNTFWLHKELKFVDASLTEVFSSLEDCYHVRFEIVDSIHSFRKFNAEFKNNSLDEVLHVLKETYPISFKKSQEQIVVTHR